MQTLRRAEVLGAAMRLAYTLCGGTPAAPGTRLGGSAWRSLSEGTGRLRGRHVLRRVETLRTSLCLDPAVEVAAA
jgi:exopolyphosphatase/guanosine-5'-triphosphate,3'-diphosphate pyrophosphatase